MGALPFEIRRLAVGRREMQRDAIVARHGDAQALRGEGDALDRARMLEFLHRAVRQPHKALRASGVGDRALRAGWRRW